MMSLSGNNLDVVGNVTASRLISDVAQGTAPLSVTSTTQVSNLNVSYLEGYQTATTNTANRIVRRDGSGNFSAGAITVGSVSSSGAISGTSLSASTQVNITGGTEYGLNINTSNQAKIVLQGTNDPYIRFREGTTDKAYIQWSSSGFLQFVNQESGELLKVGSGVNGLTYTDGGTEYKVFHAGNDGSGSGLDADTLDGINSASFLRSDANASTSGSLTMSVDTTDALNFSANSTNDNRGISFNGRTAVSADYNDGFLRLNHQGEFANGVYTPGNFRADGRIYVDNGTNYLSYPTGNYGSIQINGAGAGGYEGYSIDGRYVLMSDDNETCGMYNDLDNRWIWLYERNDYLDLKDPDGTDTWLRIDNGEIYAFIHMRFDDNDEVRLGTGADFRMRHDGTHHYFRNYLHAGGDMYWQGEDTAGANHAMIYMYTNNTRPYVSIYEDGSERFRTTSTGVTVYGTVVATSDEKYKKNIEKIENALHKIDQIDGVTFDWDNDAFLDSDDESVSKPNFDKRSTGVIAQKVEKVLPEAVTEDSNTGMKNVAYGNMIGLLIEGIKELNERLNTIEERLDNYEGNT